MSSWQTSLPRLAVPSQETLDSHQFLPSWNEASEVATRCHQMSLLSHATAAGMLMWERLLMQLVEEIEGWTLSLARVLQLVEGIKGWTLSSARFLQSLLGEAGHWIVT